MKFISLANRNMKEIYRDPVSILLGLAMPVALLILFTSIHKKVQLELFSAQMLTPGIIIFCYSFLIMFSAILLAKDRQSALLTRLFATPLKPSDFLLAYVLPFLPLALFQTIICLILGLILGSALSNIFSVLCLLFLIALVCISLGIILGSLLSVNQVSGVGSLLITAIGLFSGAWIDLKMVGGLFDTIGYALPFAHAVDAVRWLMAGKSFVVIINNFYWVLIYSVALFLLAILSFRWKMREG